MSGKTYIKIKIEITVTKNVLNLYISVRCKKFGEGGRMLGGGFK